MNLLSVRKQFVEVSGRYDLVSDAVDFADNGADYYITEGQRWLERKLNITPTTGKYLTTISAGDYLLSFSHCRAIYDVWVMSNDARTQLTKMDAGTIRNLSVTLPLATAEKQQPYMYYPTNLRRSPDDEDGTSDSDILANYIDVFSPSNAGLSKTGIVIYPPADTEYVIEIDGLFYVQPLEDDADENYWSTNFPALLVRAALRMLASFWAGGKSVRDWDTIIDGELTDIIKDAVEEEISKVDHLEG